MQQGDVKMKLKNKRRKSEIILFIPPSPLIYPRMLCKWLSHTSPLGIGYISSILKKEGFQVSCFNLYTGLRKLKSFECIIRENRPKLIGFSTMTENYNNGILLAKVAKNICSNSTIIFGGSHVTFMDKEVLCNNDCVDIIVRGEGELTMLELSNYFVQGKGTLENIKGISYRVNGEIVRTEARPLIKDLDKLPFPDRDISDLDGVLSSYEARNSIITSRGCSGRCKFCAASALAGGKYRMRSVDNVVSEIEDLAKKGYKNISFADDTISVDISRFLKLCNIIKNYLNNWSCECRVDAMTKEVARTLANSGCKGLQFGVESGSQELLDRMGKNITIKQIKQAVKWCIEAGLDVICSLMVGIPEDTMETIKQTIDFAEMLEKEYGAAVIMACTVPYPGTYYFNHAKDLGVFISTRNYNLYSTSNAIMDTPHLTRWQIRNVYYEAIIQLFKSMPEKYKELFGNMSRQSLLKEGYYVPTYSESLEREV